MLIFNFACGGLKSTVAKQCVRENFAVRNEKRCRLIGDSKHVQLMEKAEVNDSVTDWRVFAMNLWLKLVDFTIVSRYWNDNGSPRQRLQRFSSAFEAENQILTFHVIHSREMIILNRHPAHHFQSPLVRTEEVQFKAWQLEIIWIEKMLCTRNGSLESSPSYQFTFMSSAMIGIVEWTQAWKLVFLQIFTVFFQLLSFSS